MKKKKKISKLNPTKEGLTEPELRILKALKRRQNMDMVTSTGDLSNDLHGLDRSWIYRKLMSLIEKGIVERYGQRFYRII